MPLNCACPLQVQGAPCGCHAQFPAWPWVHKGRCCCYGSCGATAAAVGQGGWCCVPWWGHRGGSGQYEALLKHGYVGLLDWHALSYPCNDVLPVLFALHSWAPGLPCLNLHLTMPCLNSHLTMPCLYSHLTLPCFNLHLTMLPSVSPVGG